MRCAVAKEARRDGNGWRMAGVTGYMLEHQKGVYCVQFNLKSCPVWTQVK